MIEMSVHLDEQDEQLITLPLAKLLKRFGAGKATPGAGSGAALMGMLACNLCVTVIKLTRQQDKYSKFWLQINFMKQRLEVLEDKLNEAFQRDSEEWEYVVQVRLKRDGEVKNSESYRQLSELARSLTEKSTDVLLEISEYCLEVLENALDLFNVGYKVVRGDTSVAAWGAFAGAKSALATAYLNLKSFRDERAASVVRGKCDMLVERVESLRVDLDTKVAELRAEGQYTNNVKPKAEEGTRESLPLAARKTNAPYGDDAPIQKPSAIAKELGIIQSDEEVFDEIFMRKKRGAWFRRVQDFFTLQGLGTFAANKGFLRYVKQAIDENRYRSAEKLTNDIVLKWYKIFDARERREGSGL
jgi:formiminotetrahydrofolate cyclodeaminase